MFEHFETFAVEHAGVTLRGRIGGKGPPLLLLHGHPQTHAMWHHVAPPLAERFTVVLPDLRGRGDSQRVAATPQHVAYAKRTKALDAVAVMRHFGFDRFAVCGHDRGARVAHRLALDHAQAVSRLMLLDVAPTLDMYEGTTEAFARAYWHWFFLIQPAPLPERAIEADPVAWIREGMGQRFAGLGPFAAEAMAEYERCMGIPGSATAICEDYRAAAGIDLEHDRADRAAGRRLTQPLRVLWGAQGVVARCFDALALWRGAHAEPGLVDGRALDCGHYLAEEKPAELLAEMRRFFEEE